ncbi:transposable element Tc1 transposase [Trichonephila clavipes]|nr:transposable element Tc1 transposase [Trichonephila clavipes]
MSMDPHSSASSNTIVCVENISRVSSRLSRSFDTNRSFLITRDTQDRETFLDPHSSAFSNTKRKSFLFKRRIFPCQEEVSWCQKNAIHKKQHLRFFQIVGSSRHEKVPKRGKPGLERPRKTTRREDRRIVRQALVNPTVTRSTIRADVGVAIVPQTISRHLAEANLKSKSPFRALPLTPEHRQLRLQWCQARSMWNVTDWQKVVFSDESRFVLGTDDKRVRVWRRPGPFPNGLPGAIFQQDNARPHTARVAQDILRHFQSLPWPARSPNLSPVEHV